MLPVAQTKLATHPHPPKDWEVEFDEDQDGHVFAIYDRDAVRIEEESWRPVQYNTTAAAERVDRIADLARRDADAVTDALVPWMSLAGIDLLQLKHPALKDEREARTIFDVKPRWKFVKHRATRFE